MDFKNLKESGRVEFKTATYPQLIPHSDIHEVEGKTILVFQISEYLKLKKAWIPLIRQPWTSS